MFEHTGLSSDTGSEVVGTPTAIKKHSQKYHHPVNLENFSVIYSANSDYQLKISLKIWLGKVGFKNKKKKC